MTFENITKNTTCNCFVGTEEDSANIFARVLYKEKATDKDFLSKWEKNQTASDCEVVCLLKGVSVSKIGDNDIKNKVINFYSGIFKISPKYKKGILLFKLKKDAGVFKATPSIDNPHHNTLFKSDLFALSFVEEIETCYLKPTVV